MVSVEEKCDKYLDLTSRALKKVKLVSSVAVDGDACAKDFLDLAKRYYSDAHHFKEKGEVLTALLAVTYAHAWLDAGARMNVFDVDGDSELFMVDEK